MLDSTCTAVSANGMYGGCVIIGCRCTPIGHVCSRNGTCSVPNCDQVACPSECSYGCCDDGSCKLSYISECRVQDM
jgi:hypothetical protein